MSEKRATVIGGSGFLGSHVCDTLSEAGFKVAIFDLKASEYLRDDQEMVVGDVLDSDAVAKAVSGADYVYNFAGIADIDEATDRPKDTAMTNIIGNINVLDACVTEKVKRYVFASSVYVYSEAGSFYRVSKRASEQFIELYQEKFGLDFTVLRYGSLYGRRSDRRNSIWRMIHDALEKKEISYGGDPESIREFIHVSDAAKLSLDILSNEYRNRHMILTGAERMRVRDVMRMIAEISNQEINLKFSSNSGNVHYAMTPYRFNPKLGHKLIATDFVDLGQGLLDCLHEAIEDAGLHDPDAES